MVQMKEQIKTPEKKLNKMEISSLQDAKFQTLFIKMLKEFSEDLNDIKKIQSEIDILIEIKNNLHRKKSRVDEAEDQIYDLEHKEAKTNQSEQEEKRIQKNEGSVSSLWHSFKQSNILFIEAVSYTHLRAHET